MTVRVLALAILCSLAGCRSREAQQIEGAVETFIDFGMSNEERTKAPSKEVVDRPHLTERFRKTHTEGRRGPWLDVEVDLPYDLDSKSVAGALRIELDRLIDEANYSKVELRGRPAGLLRYGGVMGRATATRGRDGEISSKVVPMVRDDQPTLTDEQYKALVDLELAIVREGRGGEAVARAQIDELHGESLVRQAINVTKRRYGVGRVRR